MSRILSLEHCARITTWHETRRRHRSRKFTARTRLACFVAFNVLVWTLFLGPIFLR